MKIGHVRERHAPAGTPWRLAGAPAGEETPRLWIDLEPARRRALARDPQLAHDSVLHRQPLTTLDDLLGRRLRVEVLRDLVDGFEPRDEDDPVPCSTPASSTSGRRSSGRRRCATSTPSRATSGRCGSAAAARSRRPGIGSRSSTSATSPRSAGRTSRSGRRRRPTSSTTSWRSPPSSTRPAIDLRADTRRGGDRRLHDLQRLVGARPAARRDRGPARAGQGQGLRRHRSVRGSSRRTSWPTRGRGTGYDLAMTADGQRHRDEPRALVATRSSRSGEMLARASADVHLRPGDLIGSGTVGSGCLLEVRDATLGRYLEPGDTVTLAVERLGRAADADRDSTR